jgi:hypothetical protein
MKNVMINKDNSQTWQIAALSSEYSHDEWLQVLERYGPSPQVDQLLDITATNCMSPYRSLFHQQLKYCIFLNLIGTQFLSVSSMEKM